jgi:alpha-beta hydrolase superfamily lysophospholipase
VLMHGFPDNLHIYDDLIPYLVAGGRRVVTFDFLGFGALDKLPDATYSFKQQLGDLDSVVEHSASKGSCQSRTTLQDPQPSISRWRCRRVIGCNPMCPNRWLRRCFHNA